MYLCVYRNMYTCVKKYILIYVLVNKEEIFSFNYIQMKKNAKEVIFDCFMNPL